jgi:dipeptidase D
VSAAPYEAIECSIRKSEAAVKEELEFSDPGFRVELAKSADEECRMTKKVTDHIIDYMYLMPNGLMHRSMKLEGLTVSSLNAGVVITEDERFIIEDLIRSAITSHTDTLICQLEVLASVYGFEVVVGERYSGWNFSANSELREVLRKVLSNRGKELVERATHGGLETGIFKGLIPDMDIITYGPIASGEHTPDEKLDLASFDRSYEILCEVLANCK